MIDASKYTITVRKGYFDGEECFEARVAELSDVAEYADSFEEAYTLAIDTIEITAELFAEQGKLMPAPIIPADDYSGRVTLRLSKSLHRTLAKAADNENVSLNQHLTNILNYYAGYAQAIETLHSINIWQSLSQPEKYKSKPNLKLVSSSKSQYLEKQYAYAK